VRAPARLFAVVAGGGTAGHVLPALSIASALVERGHEASSICIVGSRRGLETALVPAAGFELVALPSRGIPRRLGVDAARATVLLAIAGLFAVALLVRRRPRVVVTVGGFAGFPPAAAAVLLRIPLVVVNVDAVPGAANRVLAPFARASAVAFPGTRLPRAVVTGTPVRPEVLAADRSAEARRAARARLGLPADRLLLVVATGSLGARRVNEAVLGLARRWSGRADLVLYHVSGRRDYASLRERAVEACLLDRGLGGAALDYRLVAYEDRLPAILGACDLALCRAGASTVAELTAIGVPSVLVPLPGAPSDHQVRNAQALERAGAAVVLEDGSCDAERLEAVLGELLGDADRRERMERAARSLGRRDAAPAVVRLVEEAAGSPGRRSWRRP